MITRICVLGLMLTSWAGCSAVTQQSDVFLSQILLKDSAYAWSPGTGSSDEGWTVSSIVIQNGGKTIVLYTSHTPPVNHILSYDAPISSNQAYYKNTVLFTPKGTDTPLKAVRYAGIRVANGRLVWAGYLDTPPLDAYDSIKTQADFDAFAAAYWSKDKIRFTKEYAVIGL